MLADPECTYFRDDEMFLFCTFCRNEMDEEVSVIANDLLKDPKIHKTYQSYDEDVRDELLFQLAEEIYFYGGELDEDEEYEDEVSLIIGLEN